MAGEIQLRQAGVILSLYLNALIVLCATSTAADEQSGKSTRILQFLCAGRARNESLAGAMPQQHLVANAGKAISSLSICAPFTDV